MNKYMMIPCGYWADWLLFQQLYSNLALLHSSIIHLILYFILCYKIWWFLKILVVLQKNQVTRIHHYLISLMEALIVFSIFVWFSLIKLYLGQSKQTLSASSLILYEYILPISSIVLFAYDFTSIKQKLSGYSQLQLLYSWTEMLCCTSCWCFHIHNVRWYLLLTTNAADWKCIYNAHL